MIRCRSGSVLFSSDRGGIPCRCTNYLNFRLKRREHSKETKGKGMRHHHMLLVGLQNYLKQTNSASQHGSDHSLTHRRRIPLGISPNIRITPHCIPHQNTKFVSSLPLISLGQHPIQRKLCLVFCSRGIVATFLANFETAGGGRTSVRFPEGASASAVAARSWIR